MIQRVVFLTILSIYVTGVAPMEMIHINPFCAAGFPTFYVTLMGLKSAPIITWNGYNVKAKCETQFTYSTVEDDVLPSTIEKCTMGPKEACKGDFQVRTDSGPTEQTETLDCC